MTAATDSFPLVRLAQEPELWPIWMQDAEVLHQATTCSSTLSVRHLAKSQARGGDFLTEPGLLQRLVLKPTSKVRTGWDLLSVLLLSHDVFMVPLSVFDLPDTTFTHVFSVFTTAFWTLDMLLSFLSGYHLAGLVEMRPRKIAWQYVTQWFFVDLTVITVDWALIILDTGVVDMASIMRVGKFMRLSRMFRLMRLLRLMKMPSLMESISDSIQSEDVATAFEIGKCVALIAVINHFIACGWYAVGTNAGEPNWLEQLNGEEHHFSYRYATCLHWSLTQFTPASMEVVPRNVYERFYAIMVLFSALVTFGSFVSSITMAMTYLRQNKEQRYKECERIKRFVSDNKISLDLSNRIMAFLRAYKFMARRRVHSSDIATFKVLPLTLMHQVHWELYGPSLITHPLLHHIHETDSDALIQICHKAMSECSLTSAHELFTEHTEATAMYFMIAGSVEYVSGPEISQAFLINSTKTPRENAALPESRTQLWFSEAVLWIRWQHLGRLRAISPCEFMALNASSFRRVIANQPSVFKHCQDYAERFRSHMLSLTSDYEKDMWNDFDELQEMAHLAFADCNIGGMAMKARMSFARSRAPVV